MAVKKSRKKDSVGRSNGLDVLPSFNSFAHNGKEVVKAYGNGAPPSQRRLRVEWHHWAILGAAIFLFAALFVLSGNRSFHQDELANIHVLMKAAEGIEKERQHAFFQKFHTWWLSRAEITERWARIPAMTFVTLGLLAFAGLAGRLGGKRAALVGAAAVLLWPRTWDDGLEMRYYGFVFLMTVLALHALVTLCRSRSTWPILALGGLLGILVLWHPTPLPFIGALILFSICVAAGRGLEAWRDWKREWKPGSFPRREILPAAVISGVALLTLIVVLAFFGERIGAGRFISNLQRIPSGSFDPQNLFLWLTSWVDDRFAPAFFPIRVLQVVFPALIVVGAFRLFRTQPLLLAGFLFAVVAHAIAAWLTTLNWWSMISAYKYMTSSGAVMLLFAVLGASSIMDWAARRSPRHLIAAIAALVLLYAAPILPRVLTSALGDASHLMHLWREIETRANGRVPLLFGTAATTQSAFNYRFLKEDFIGIAIRRHDFGNEIIPYLMDRDHPFFVAYPGDEGPIPYRELLREVKSYRSNFTPLWDIEFLEPAGTVRLLPGKAVSLDAGESALVLDEGNWIVEGKGARLNGQAISGVAFSAKRGDIVEAAAGPIGVAPDYASAAVRRPAAFAQRGPLMKHNRPMLMEDNDVYLLCSNLSVAYDFDLPMEPMDLVIETWADEPLGPEFFVLADERPIALFARDSAIESGTPIEFRLRVPQDLLGRRARFQINFLAANSAREEDSDSVAAMRIGALRLERHAGGASLTPSYLGVLTPAPLPAWAPGGMYSANVSAAELLWTTYFFEKEGDANIEYGKDEGNIVMAMPDDLASQFIGLPPFAVSESQAVAVEFMMRSRNVLRKTVAPIILYYDKDQNQIGRKDLSHAPVGRDDTWWTVRRGISTAPAGSAFAILGLYVTSPDAAAAREDARFELKHIRFFLHNEE